jgi:hypothetical protein
MATEDLTIEGPFLKRYPTARPYRGTPGGAGTPQGHHRRQRRRTASGQGEAQGGTSRVGASTVGPAAGATLLRNTTRRKPQVDATISDTQVNLGNRSVLQYDPPQQGHLSPCVGVVA